MFLRRFLPAPVPLRKDKQGPIVPEPHDGKASDRYAGLWKRLALSFIDQDLPYDAYCPVKKDVGRRQCKACKIYFTSMEAVKVSICLLNYPYLSNHPELIKQFHLILL